MYTEVHKQLQKWYQQEGRHHLPWRNHHDAYKIWVSEIMLQQTQVKTVLERFYFPFLDAFPTLEDLAKSSEDAVLKQWEGLGYYTRARNLHKTAQLCQKELPTTIHELIKLPGIGKSTAHAIAAFSYHTPVPILDANVKRILCRVFGVKQAQEKTLWELAYKLFDSAHPYNYNQALMDLGATLCESKRTACEACPFESICLAKDDDPLSYPKKRAKKSIPVRHKNIIIFTQKNALALQQRKTQFLHGLWGFMEQEEPPSPSAHYLGDIVQKYSHFHLYAKVYQQEHFKCEAQWFTINETKELALSGADHKALALFIKHNKVSKPLL